ncbi:glycosyltransferase family 2 protein [Hymenobacter arizonensis]|uniref:Glycosyl transferase family 2 n=1 Tax=Hymenobacter arizonensis TaxID=1227077 RepID=A0A1I6BTS0_HYMAR|nr:glycosyltransferase [Hymenobacter arizonensis]SFQ84310.1 Glycosyl transferase family 2 [Hymenobacter arizonensis]
MKFAFPLVTVLMPVYNAELYVKDSINSILEQSFCDFELIVFNDGSTDRSRDVILSILDSRIVFIDSSVNVGYVAHLNNGLDIARGKYIARMDADDIALASRFEQQVALLEQQPEIGLCGTAFSTFDAQSVTIKLPVKDFQIREFMLRDSPMGHPTVMFRSKLVKDYGLRYNQKFMPAEDYKLWYDFSKITQLANLPEVLLNYRVHSHQVSSYLSQNQRNNADAVRVLQLIDKGFHLTENEQELYCQMLRYDARPQTTTELKLMLKLMQKITDENERLNAYDSLWFRRLFENVWRDAINDINQYTPMHLSFIIFPKKPVTGAFGFLDKAKFLLKGLIGWKGRKFFLS